MGTSKRTELATVIALIVAGAATTLPAEAQSPLPVYSSDFGGSNSAAPSGASRDTTIAMGVPRLQAVHRRLLEVRASCKPMPFPPMIIRTPMANVSHLVETVVAETALETDPVETAVAGIPVETDPVETAVAGIPVETDPVETAVAGIPVETDPVETAVAGIPAGIPVETAVRLARPTRATAAAAVPAMVGARPESWAGPTS